MDILSHGLWAAAGAQGANETSPLRSRNKKINAYWALFWGMFPDLFAFTIPFVWLLWRVVTGEVHYGDWPRPEQVEPVGHEQWPMFQLASTLYRYSHSLVVFGIVAIAVLLYCYTLKKRIPFEMLGWPLHIFMDIPTHTYQFYPTPVFWPISEWRYDGVSWAHPEFLAVDYLLLVLVFGFFYWRRRTRRVR